MLSSKSLFIGFKIFRLPVYPKRWTHIQSFNNIHTAITFLYRAYNDVGWENKLPPTLSYPSTTAFTNTRPDAVSLRFSNKRHEVYSQEWQVRFSCSNLVDVKLMCNSD